MRQTNKRTKIGIVGCGHVGSHVASMLLLRGICQEIVMIDTDDNVRKGHTIDLMDTAAYRENDCKIQEGDYTDIKDADILIISVAGKYFEEDRLQELGDSIQIIDKIAPKIEKSGFAGVVIVITNPCDLVAYYLNQKISATVIGSGTILDSARFRVRIARELNVDSASVQGWCFGEHGDSQVPIWSQVRINGMDLGKVLYELGRQESFPYQKIEQSTIFAGWEIASAKGSTEFGIGMAASELIKSILTDANTVLPCSTLLDGEYGERDVYASVLCTIGAGGVKKIWEVPVTEKEQKALHHSCKVLKSYIREKM